MLGTLGIEMNEMQSSWYQRWFHIYDPFQNKKGDIIRYIIDIKNLIKGYNKQLYILIWQLK